MTKDALIQTLLDRRDKLKIEYNVLRELREPVEHTGYTLTFKLRPVFDNLRFAILDLDILIDFIREKP